MDRERLLYALLKELNDNSQISAELLGLDNMQYYQILNLAYTSKFINKLPEPVRGVGESEILYFVKEDINITLDGIKYLKDNSALGKTYRGLKELREWIKL
ncbi:YjcQ family protein [Clostridium paraputrificum]|uniref:YjcQ family protein n=1 Tax=Clostridium paraputrificum TaxID=29363 RepID=UPI00189B5250|nr:YjcQ family protein [Clostridium paraputrificum]MDB2108913.1 YjcQ family protein [Clostridium paraputrificum]DAU71193.1 MAG TPA: YjcQ protein [Caudoviricetes sp.]